ncbi:MAG TPA: polyphosphate polymerase domain-containing protein [Bacillota bacterium]|nr:polyphosphate polymerase domain-containing protein [Bacillota bacterium]
MSSNNLNRLENKYVINKAQYDNIKKSIEPFMTMDAHYDQCMYHISNIYYDTEQNLIIKKSVSKPVFKEKLRLRGYGEIKCDDLLYLEIKKKVSGYVSKRRTKILQEEVDLMIDNHEMPKIEKYHHPQVLKEIFYYIEKYNVKPAIFLSYDREAYFAIDNQDLRLTFDFHIITRRDHLNLCQGNLGKKLLSDDYCVMEIKTNQNFPYWLIEILNKNKVYSVSFSKYGTEFYNYLNDHDLLKGGQKSCGLNPYLKALR